MYKFPHSLILGLFYSFFGIMPALLHANNISFKLELTQIGTDYAELNLSLPEMMKEVEIFRSSDNTHFNSVKTFVESRNHYMIIDPFDQNLFSLVFYKIVCVNLKGEPFVQKFSFSIEQRAIHFSLKNTTLSIHQINSDYKRGIPFYIFNDQNAMIFEGVFKGQQDINLPMIKSSNEVWYIYYDTGQEKGVQRISRH